MSARLDDIVEVLLDIEGIAPCMPGAQLQEVDGDEYRGVVKVKVGPITAQYKGTATLAEIDEAARRIVIDAAGRDTRGQGNAKAPIVVTMAGDGDGTDVSVDTDLTITGKVAQFGRGVLADVSPKLLGQFVDYLEHDHPGLADPERGAGLPGRAGPRRRPACPADRRAAGRVGPRAAGRVGPRAAGRVDPRVVGRVDPRVVVPARGEPVAAVGPPHDRRARGRAGRPDARRGRRGRQAGRAPRGGDGGRGRGRGLAARPLKVRRPTPPAPLASNTCSILAGPVLGIDPGLSRCGYGAVRRRSGGLATSAYGVMRTDPAAPLPERLAALDADLEVFVAEIHPSRDGGRAGPVPDQRTHRDLGRAGQRPRARPSRRGPGSRSPTTARTRSSWPSPANGAADKRQVQDMVTRLLGLAEPPPPDAADALALAVCQLWRAPLRAGVDRAVAAGRAP